MTDIFQAATRRTKLFKEAKLQARHLTAVSNAGLTSFKPLVLGDFGIVWTERGLRVGKGEIRSVMYDCIFLHFLQSNHCTLKVAGRTANIALSTSTPTSARSRSLVYKYSSKRIPATSGLFHKLHHYCKHGNSASSRHLHSSAVLRELQVSPQWVWSSLLLTAAYFKTSIPGSPNSTRRSSCLVHVKRLLSSMRRTKTPRRAFN